MADEDVKLALAIAEKGNKCGLGFLLSEFHSIVVAEQRTRHHFYFKLCCTRLGVKQTPFIHDTRNKKGNFVVIDV